MKLKFVFSLLLAPACFTIAQGQDTAREARVFTEGFYINLGTANGPDFGEFFDFTNSYYASAFLNSSDKLKKFDDGLNFGMGYLVRLYPNFALDVGFSIYRLRSKGRIDNRNLPPIQVPYIEHDLEYQVGLFSATIPVLLDFDPRQPIVPYFGIGVSIFSMRLDDFRDDGVIGRVLRETNTSAGGHFEAGIFVKLKRRIWVDLKGRWHSGTAKLRALEPALPIDGTKYKVKQDVSQYTLGVVYFFR